MTTIRLRVSFDRTILPELDPEALTVRAVPVGRLRAPEPEPPFLGFGPPIALGGEASPADRLVGWWRSQPEGGVRPESSQSDPTHAERQVLVFRYAVEDEHVLAAEHAAAAEGFVRSLSAPDAPPPSADRGRDAFVAMGNRSPTRSSSPPPRSPRGTVFVGKDDRSVCLEVLDGITTIASVCVPLSRHARARTTAGDAPVIEHDLNLDHAMPRPWALGVSQEGDAFIPRLVRHASQQHTTPMINWEVDTNRTYEPLSNAGKLRTSYGWDVVFGRAALRGVPHTRPFYSPGNRSAFFDSFLYPMPSRRIRPTYEALPLDLDPSMDLYTGFTPMGLDLRAIHNRDKLISAQDDTGWIPWVLAYADSVGIPFGRIVGTVSPPGRPDFDSLEAMQADAVESWTTRGLLGTGTESDPVPGPVDRWDLGDASLLDRLLNGMCPHDPTVEDVPGSESPQGRLVWTLTWTGTDPDGPRYAQDGVFDVDSDYDICENARMPDIRVESTPAPRNLESAGPQLQGAVSLGRIGLRFPGASDYTYFEPTGETGPVAPSAAAFTTGWAYAKWFVRQALLVAGQIDWHLARCHVFMEQMCATLCSELRRVPSAPGGQSDHPLLQKLWPFIRSADEINAFGDLTLLSADGVLSMACCLSHPAAMARLRRQRASWIWNRSPVRRPTCENDHFAVWADFAWRACTAWADGMLAAEADLLRGLTSGELLGDRVRAALERVHRAHLGTDVPETWWGTAGDPPEAPSDAVPAAGAWRAPESRSDWRDFIAHLLYTATFLHSWVGGRQFSDMGNVFVSSAGHRWSDIPLGPNDTHTPEQAVAEWHARGPIIDHAGFIISLSELIGENDWGRFAHLEDELEVYGCGQVPETLREKFYALRDQELEANAPLRAALGRLPAERIRTRICI